MLLSTKKQGIENPEKREEIHKVEPTEFERQIQNYVMMCMDFELGDDEGNIIENGLPLPTRKISSHETSEHRHLYLS